MTNHVKYHKTERLYMLREHFSCESTSYKKTVARAKDYYLAAAKKGHTEARRRLSEMKKQRLIYRKEKDKVKEQDLILYM